MNPSAQSKRDVDRPVSRWKPTRRSSGVIAALVVVVAFAAALFWWSGKRSVERTVGGTVPVRETPKPAASESPRSVEGGTSNPAALKVSEGSGVRGASGDTPNPTGAGIRDETGLEVLEGRWLRPDGGYIVHIAGIASDGTLDASYYNPRPIRVSRAETARDDGVIRVFIELNDIGYPFCTYDLRYDPADDVLVGVYVQKAVQQSFDVVFVRAP